MSSHENAQGPDSPEVGPEKTPGRSGWLGWGASVRTRAERRRAIRVWLLVGTIAVLSMADLYMTLAHLRSAGMGEDNPFARLVMSYKSPLLLGAWKAACVMLACLILVLARFRRSGEVACWLSCVVLTALIVRWAHYSAEASAFTAEINSATHEGTPANWVSMGPE